MGDMDTNHDDLKESLITDFGFGFNDSNFSDRILRLEIVAAGDDEAANSDGLDSSEDSPIVLRVKTLHIDSLLLAAKSPFFYKLFSNGMMESEQKHATLRINNHEEAALMELLSFMYCNTLTSKTAPALLDVLRVADKFEVASCMIHCNHSLSNLPMTTEYALLLLSLPSSILMADKVKHLTDATKQFLADRYKDISKCQEEVINFPLVGIEAILSSDDLHVTSEDEVYDFALKWIKAHYQKPNEQKEIFSNHLGPYIRFPYMTCKKLRNILTCNDFDHEFVTKYLLDALLFKVEASYHQRIHVKEEPTSTNRRFIERVYTNRPVKMYVIEHPKQQSFVYLDLKREECAKLSPSGNLRTQDFHLGEQDFFLYAECRETFGLYIWMQQNGLSTIDVEYEFFARSKPTEMYISLGKLNHTFTEGKWNYGYSDLFRMPWSSFMAENCVYFINGVLHLRVELTVKR